MSLPNSKLLHKRLLQVEYGPITTWSILSTSLETSSYVIAFQMRDLELVVRDPKNDKFDKKMLALVPHSRFAKPLTDEEFEKQWELATDDYLYPRRIGILKQDWPELVKEVPLDILADWLQEHDHEESAKILREAHKEKNKPTT